QPHDLFAYLRAAFREKRTTPQLLHAFYARKQLEEALMWFSEERPDSVNVVRSRNLVGVGTDEETGHVKTATTVPSDLRVALQEIIKVITQQGKAISELTNA
ncbi:hypothetical protein KOW79_022386, partial [Hemibagrus wyckioides]